MALDWSVQQMRVSLFSSEAFPVSESGWKLLTGQDEAENRVNVPGGRQYSGKLLDGLLALTVTLNRVDIVLAFDPTKPMEISSAQIPLVGKWIEVWPSFAAAVEPFLETATSPIVRLAFGASLLALAPSREETYKNLASSLKSVQVDVVNMRELIFRINWPQTSSVVPGLEINRITSWGALVFAINAMQAASSGFVLSPGTQAVHAVSLEIDHNTSGDRKDPFENRHLVPIFRELVTLANENAEGGERP